MDPRALSPGQVLHLQRTLGNRAVGRLLGRGAAPVLRAAPSGTLARKVGFEFETQWKLLGPSGLFNEKTKLMTGTGWDLTADVWESGDFKALGALFGPDNVLSRGELEFATEAVEESDAGREALVAAMDGIVEGLAQVAGNLKLHEEDPSHGYGPLAQAGVDPKPMLWVDRRDRKAHARPQMTAGFKLSALPRVLGAIASPQEGAKADIAGYLRGHEGFAEAQAGLQVVLAKVEAARQGPDPLPPLPLHGGDVELADRAPRDEYWGAVANVAAAAVWITRDGINFAKYAAPLLSRTNLGRYAETFRTRPWKDHILSVLPDELDASTRVLPASPSVALTLGAWLDAVGQGDDPLDWGQKKLPEWEPQGVGEKGQREVGHVFELRALKTHVPYDEWKDFALDHFDYVRETLNRTEPTRRVAATGYEQD